MELRRRLEIHSWPIDGALLVILLTLTARGAEIIDNGRAVLAIATALGAAAIAITRTESERRAREVRRRIALRRLRECAGTLLKGVANFRGKCDAPEEWGRPRPPMNLADLARAMREGHAVYYTGEETKAVTAWAATVRDNRSRFASCAQALVPDLSDADRDVLQQTQHAAGALLAQLERLTQLRVNSDSFREDRRQVRASGIDQEPRDTLAKQIGETHEKLAPAAQQLSDLLVAIARRAN